MIKKNNYQRVKLTQLTQNMPETRKKVRLTGSSPDAAEDYFASLRAKCLRDGVLYEDRDFPPNLASIGNMTSRDFDQTAIIWRRPKDIIAGAEFVVGDISRFDAVQGDSLANCWFISATACLAVTNLPLLQRCIPFEQSLTKEYAGIFHFYFWNFDEWVEVIIDDKLPTINGELIFAKNRTQPNEFWVALFEKAYAKLKGSYGNLDGGQTTYALVDFTGGITERVNLKERRWSGRDELFNMISDGIKRSSMLGCDITSQPGGFESSTTTGLYKSHAYAVTNLVQITDKNSKPLKLIRIRNPWAEGEWKGRWSDGSRDWSTITDDIKRKLDVENNDEGEFWMSYEDWLNNFDWLTICHIQPDEFTEELSHDKDKHDWREQKHHSEWIKGFNAGGPPSTYNSRFWTNPQFEFIVDPPASTSSSGQASNRFNTSSSSSSTGSHTHVDQGSHIIVSLMQKSLNWDSQLIISFKVYQIKKEVKGVLTADNYDKSALTLAGDGPQPACLREMTGHFCLPPGRYVIIPYTLSTGEEAHFLLRIFAETEVKSGELDIVTAIKGPGEKTSEDLVKKAFETFAKGDPTLDATELTGALNSLLNLNMNANEDLITTELSRVLMSRYDIAKPWLIDLSEMRTMYSDICKWMEKFNLFDNDKSGNVDTYELNPLLQSIDITVSRQVQLSIVRHYGGKANRITMQDFLHCCCRLLALHDYFLKQSGNNRTGTIQLDLDEWLAASILL